MQHPNPSTASADEIANRIVQMLNVGIAAVRSGDDLGALLAVQEAHKAAKSARSLPICLPDRSHERIRRTTMSAPKDHQPPKPRTAARSWARVEAIDKQIAKHEMDIASLKNERAEIVEKLDTVLRPQ